MANRTIGEHADLWEQLRGIVASYDVKIITATAPRERCSMPHTPKTPIIIDYPGVLNPGNLLTIKMAKNRKGSSFPIVRFNNDGSR